MRVPKLSRRNFLGGLFAALLSRKVRAWPVHGIAQTRFNGGVTQTNTLGLVNLTTWQFMNLMLQSVGPTYNTAPGGSIPQLPVAELDSNGYVTSILSGTGGVRYNFVLFPTGQYSGVYVLDWIGNGTLVVPGNGSTTGFIPNTGFSFSNLTSTTGSGRYEFTCQNDTTATNAFVQVTALGSPYISQIRCYRKVDETALNAGKILGADFSALMTQANPGCFRSLGWVGSSSNGTNDSNIALWAHRKPRSYVSYRAQSWIPSAYAGLATQSGNTYTITGTAALSDKLLQHFLSPAAPANNIQTTCSITNSSVTGQPAQIGITNHQTVVGDLYTFATGGGSIPSPFVAGTRYYVASVIDANNVTLAATRGGAAISTTAAGTAVTVSLWMTLSIDGGLNYHLMTSAFFPTSIQATVGFSNNRPSANSVITAVYDQATDAFVLGSSTAGGGNVGILNGVPPEVFVDVCASLGMNPWIVSPYLTMETGASVDGITDFMPSWASYIKTNYPWMKPVIEPANEEWNPQFIAQPYSIGVAWSRWSLTNDANNQVYGKWASTLGQAMSTLFNNDRTKYSAISAIQSVFGSTTGNLNSSANRFNSAAYVTNNHGGNTAFAAYNWIDRGCCATYFSPAERSQCQELIDAFNWTVTNAGSPSGQSAIAEAYVNTCASAAPTGSQTFTLPFNLTIFTTFTTFLQGMPAGNTIKGIVGYEGGYSPDYNPGNWQTGITGATQTNPCVLTLAATSSNSENSSMSGNPATIGMAISPTGVGGMTGLNLSSAVTATFTQGSANITVSGSAPPVNSNVVFNNANQNINSASGSMPPDLVQGQPYIVVFSSGTTIQVSLTQGGTAITINTLGSGTTQVQQCFVVTAVSGNQVTIDFDASAQPAYTSGGSCVYTFSQSLANNLRWAGKFTSALGTQNAAQNSQFFGVSSAGWTMEWVSNFQYIGANNVWPILDPSLYAPKTPQWNSIVSAN